MAPGVRRVTVPNPSPMTFTGTQTYLVGDGAVAVIDPGPDIAEHRAAILAALAPGERVTHILVTHTHVDHSPGAAPLKAETGAEVWAFGRHGAGESAVMRDLAASGADMGGGEGADRRFAPDRLLEDGQTVASPDQSGGAASWALTALATPGHLSNHLSFALEGTGAVFSGDHVMGWATTMVSPPDGDMAAFMASLRKMRARDDRVYYPGHGHPVTDPAGMIDHLIGHRLGRERQIVDALSDGPATPAELTALIYADVDPALHGAAARNVLSHLIGLIDAGRAASDGPVSPGARYRLL